MSEYRHPEACRLCGSAQATLIDVERQEQRTFSILAKPVRLKEMTGVVRDALRQAYDWPS